jgi:hypothetical protein
MPENPGSFTPKGDTEGVMARHACARRAPQGDLYRSDRCGEGSMGH